MPDNYKTKVTIGDTGVVIRATLKDTNPVTEVLEAFSLANWQSVTMTAKRGSTVVLNQLACAIDPDQTTNTGKVTCTFDALVATYPNIRKGKCDLEFKAIDPAGDQHSFPNNYRDYGVLEFKDGLS